MSAKDNPDLFTNDDMRRRWDITYEFLASSGAVCSLDKQYLLEVLSHLGESLHMHVNDEHVWKAYVLVDVLIDRWDECVQILKEEEVDVEESSGS